MESNTSLSQLDRAAQQQRRRRLDHLRNCLDPLVFVFWKREVEGGPYIPCPPGQEFELVKRCGLTLHEPRVGQGTFKFWQPAQSSLPPPPSVFTPIHLRYPSLPPPNSLGRIPATTEVIYSGFVRWSPTISILATNTIWFPPAPFQSPVTILEDGYWGPYEITLTPQAFDRHAPWLAYIPIQHPMFRPALRWEHRNKFWENKIRRVKKNDEWALHTTNLQTWKRDTEDTLVVASFALINRVEEIIKTILDRRNHLNRDVQTADLPHGIIARVRSLFGMIGHGVLGWKEFLLSVRALFRATLELAAFVAWAMDVWQYPHCDPRRDVELRGAIFESYDHDLFLAFAHCGLPAYLRLDRQPIPDSNLPCYSPSTPRCDMMGSIVHGSGS